MSRDRVRLLLLASAALALRPVTGAAQHAAGPHAVLQRARGASGGPAWSRFRGLHETGLQDGAPYERWIDGLRWGERLETGAPGAARRIYGYNGLGAWWRPLGARTEPGAERDVLARARSEAFFAAYGFYFGGRFDQRGGWVGSRQAGGRRFTVIWVQPAGGEARDLWFDDQSGLLARMTDRTAAPRTVEVSDYRRVGRLLLPHRRVAFGGGLARPVERVALKIETVAPDRGLFSLPRPG